MSHLVNASHLEGVLAGDQPIWLILERHPQTFERLYALDAAPDVHWLFHGTRYAELTEQSPLVVRTLPGSDLVRAFDAGHGTPPLQGVLVSSSASQERVLAHLRDRLDIRFYGNRNALFRYYDPWIAASFFASDAAAASWQGPLEGVMWYGGTFEQRAERGATWYACVAPAGVEGALLHAPPASFRLSSVQERALEAFVAQYPLWQQLIKRTALDETSADHARRFVAAWDEASRLSIPHHELADYLALRFVHHQASLPDDVLAQPVEQRLTILQQHFTTSETQDDIGRRRA